MNLLLAQVFAFLSSSCLLISFWQKKRIYTSFYNIFIEVNKSQKKFVDKYINDAASKK